MSRFEGVVPALITPMTADGEIHEEALRQVMEFNIQAGVTGFWVAGGTGESILLDDAENMRIAEIAADQNQGRIQNIHHVGAPSTRSAAQMAEHAAKAGVEAICCVPPFFYLQDRAGIVEHYRIVAAAADLPFFCYNVPQMTNQEITLDLMQAIQERVPQLQGLKHSAPNLQLAGAFADMGLDVLIGNSALFLPALSLGATGCVDGPPNVAPELWVEIFAAFQAGDIARAQTAQQRATALTDFMRSFGHRFHATAKAILSERLGMDCGGPRGPSQPLSAAQRERLQTELADFALPAVPTMTMV